MDFDLEEEADIICIAIEVEASKKAQPLIDYFNEKHQREVMACIYHNLGETYQGIMDAFGAESIDEAKEMIEDNFLVGESIYSFKGNCKLMSEQIKLMDTMKISLEVRDSAIEDKAKELINLIED